MKKIYNSPAIETTILCCSLMQTEHVSNDNMQGNSGNSFGGGGAPQRKLF